jgi:hypothetical protein
MGNTLRKSANGLDDSPVSTVGIVPPIARIGNSTTTPADLDSVEKMKRTFYLLAERVASRLRDQSVLSAV